MKQKRRKVLASILFALIAAAIPATSMHMDNPASSAADLDEDTQRFDQNMDMGFVSDLESWSREQGYININQNSYGSGTINQSADALIRQNTTLHGSDATARQRARININQNAYLYDNGTVNQNADAGISQHCTVSERKTSSWMDQWNGDGNATCKQDAQININQRAYLEEPANSDVNQDADAWIEQDADTTSGADAWVDQDAGIDVNQSVMDW